MDKIIKVIVDELPYGCEICRWMTYDGYCALTGEALSEVSDERDSECPLVTHNQAFDWIFFEAKATKYIEETITDIANGKVPKYKLLNESEDE
jgi:hypothetical protein